MSALNWVRFIFAWDPRLTQYFKASKLEDYQQKLEYCKTFNAILPQAIPNSSVWAGKSRSVTLNGRDILQILQLTAPQALTEAHRALNVQNNVALYEAILFINAWPQILNGIQPGMLAYEYLLQNKTYCKKFTVPDIIWTSGNQLGWLAEMGVGAQSIWLSHQQILDIFYTDGSQRTF